MNGQQEKIPLVSIKMLAYNHGKLIGRAIEGVLMQKRDFPIELVIGEDRSTDNTMEVVKSYRQKYPDIIRIVTSESNVGATKNSLRTFLACRGKYVAHCEGDDYWTDPYKLRKQVDFLEANPEYIMVSNNALQINERDHYTKAKLVKECVEDFDFTMHDLMVYNPCVTLTVLFKNINNKPLPKIYLEGRITDRQLWKLLSQYGKGRFINDVVGVYRKHAGGLTHKASKDYEREIRQKLYAIDNAEQWNRYYDMQYSKEEKILKEKECNDLFLLYIKTWQFKKALDIIPFMNTEKLKSKKASFLYRLLSLLR